MVRVRFVPEPPRVMLLFGTRAELPEVAVTTRLLVALSMSPTAKLIGPRVESSLIFFPLRLEMKGGSLTGVTLRTKVSDAVREPSEAVTVMVAEPDWFAAGVTEMVRFVPEPAKTILDWGTKATFE